MLSDSENKKVFLIGFSKELWEVLTGVKTFVLNFLLRTRNMQDKV